MSQRDHEREFLSWARRAGRGVKESKSFVSLWSDKMRSDPASDPAVVLQLGMAMLLDKPIIVVAPHGAQIPDNVRRVARAVTFYNPSDLPSLEHATRAALLEAGIIVS